MKIQVKLFAAARQFHGEDSISIELSSDATIGELRTELVRRIPALEPMSHSLRIAVNSDYAVDDATLNETDELACIPPVSGG